MNNKYTTPFQRRYFSERRYRHSQITSGRYALLSDGLDKPSEKKQKLRDTSLTQEQINAKLLNANFRIMEQIRERVDQEVNDPEVAALLKVLY